MASDSSRGIETGVVTGLLGIAMCLVAVIATPTTEQTPAPVWAGALLLTSIILMSAGVVVAVVGSSQSLRGGRTKGLRGS